MLYPTRPPVSGTLETRAQGGWAQDSELVEGKVKGCPVKQGVIVPVSTPLSYPSPCLIPCFFPILSVSVSVCMSLPWLNMAIYPYHGHTHAHVICDLPRTTSLHVCYTTVLATPCLGMPCYVIPGVSPSGIGIPSLSYILSLLLSSLFFPLRTEMDGRQTGHPICFVPCLLRGQSCDAARTVEVHFTGQPTHKYFKGIKKKKINKREVTSASRREESSANFILFSLRVRVGVCIQL